MLVEQHIEGKSLLSPSGADHESAKDGIIGATFCSPIAVVSCDG